MKEPHRTREERQDEREVEPAAPLRPDVSDPGSDEPHEGLNEPVDEADPDELAEPYEPDDRHQRRGKDPGRR